MRVKFCTQNPWFIFIHAALKSLNNKVFFSIQAAFVDAAQFSKFWIQKSYELQKFQVLDFGKDMINSHNNGLSINLVVTEAIV